MAKKIDPAVEKELKAIRADLKKVIDYAERVDAQRTKDTDAVQKQIQDLDKKYAAAINARH